MSDSTDSSDSYESYESYESCDYDDCSGDYHVDGYSKKQYKADMFDYQCNYNELNDRRLTNTMLKYARHKDIIRTKERKDKQRLRKIKLRS
jgi:hypothetical protein